MRIIAAIPIIYAAAALASAQDLQQLGMLSSELPPYGAVGEWRFLPGQNTADESGNSRTMTPNSMVSFRDGYVSVTGPTGFLTTADFAYPTNAFSVFAWVATTNIDNKCIVAHYNNAAGNFRSWYMLIVNTAWTGIEDGYFAVVLSADGGASILKAYGAGNDFVADGNWHHVGFTFSPNNLLLYVDGKVATVTRKVSDYTINAVFDCPYQVSIGCYNTDSGGESGAGIHGDIGGVCIFPRTLDRDEVMQMFMKGPPQ